MSSTRNKPVKTFKSKQDIERLLNEQLTSGLSVKAFCASIGLQKGTFYYWKNKVVPSASGRKKIGFAPVSILPSPVSHLFAEVGSVTVSAAYLKELLP